MYATVWFFDIYRDEIMLIFKHDNSTIIWRYRKSFNYLG